ncbi:MAG: hypothetical protein DLM66_00330 [Candidatus Dormiibacter spiritus]|nr:MAG: hypothetical protein DLM66_00330 [Candidatus Dormibacteraeota bacterium]
MLEPQEGPKLVAQGRTIVLGGSPVLIKFDNRALVELERRWGSINAFAQELQKGGDGKMFTCISDAIAATVRNLPVDPTDLIDLNRFPEYAEAIGAAFMEAMPEVPVEPEQGKTPDAPLSGETSSIVESSSGGWRPPTSGP